MAQSVYPSLQANKGFPITKSDSVVIKNDFGNKEEVPAVYVHNRDEGGEVTVMPAGQPLLPIITLSGTSGTANITVKGVAYLATFDTSLTETAEDFVDTHGKALQDRGFDVSSNGAEVRIKNVAPSEISIANVSGNLSGSALSRASIVIYIPQGGTSEMMVSQVYSTGTVPTNLTAYYGGQR
jgi:hypothetical protein